MNQFVIFEGKTTFYNEVIEDWDGLDLPRPNFFDDSNDE